MITAPEYTCGRSELDSPSIPIAERTSFTGPRIRKIDLFGIPFFPAIPTHSSLVWECHSPIDHLSLWNGGQQKIQTIAISTRDSHLHLISDLNYSNQRITKLDLLTKNDCTLLFVHPSVPSNLSLDS